MFVLLILFGSYKLCSAVAFYLRAYAPTNIALDYFRSRRGLKWALPASLILTPAYWGSGYAITTLIENGGPGWLNLLAALLAWNGLKFAMLGLWSPILLARARLSARLATRRSAVGIGGKSRCEHPPQPIPSGVNKQGWREVAKVNTGRVCRASTGRIYFAPAKNDRVLAVMHEKDDDKEQKRFIAQLPDSP